MKNCAQLQKWIFYLFIQNPKCASHSKWCHQMLQNDVIKCCKMMSHSNNCCVVHEPAICEDLDLHVVIFHKGINKCGCPSGPIKFRDCDFLIISIHLSPFNVFLSLPLWKLLINFQPSVFARFFPHYLSYASNAIEPHKQYSLFLSDCFHYPIKHEQWRHCKL